jgi:hypothetical protein
MRNVNIFGEGYKNLIEVALGKEAERVVSTTDGRITFNVGNLHYTVLPEDPSRYHDPTFAGREIE